MQRWPLRKASKIRAPIIAVHPMQGKCCIGGCSMVDPLQAFRAAILAALN